MGIARIFSLLLFSIFVSHFGQAFEPTEANLRSQCPKDKELCFGKAMAGECFGSSLKAQVLNKNCPCVCPLALHSRIQKCCKAVGKPEMKFCLPLCGYNTTTDDLSSGLGIKCANALSVWSYCASDNNDNTACCKSRGVVNECLSFCKGDVPTCDLQSIFSYQPCLKQLKTIIQCQVENLTVEPRYDKDWTSQCEWE